MEDEKRPDTQTELLTKCKSIRGDILRLNADVDFMLTRAIEMGGKFSVGVIWHRINLDKLGYLPKNFFAKTLSVRLLGTPTGPIILIEAQALTKELAIDKRCKPIHITESEIGIVWDRY